MPEHKKDITELIDLKTLKLADEVLGSRKETERWFNDYPAAFGGKTPKEYYVQHPKEVRKVLYRIAYGIVS